MEDLIDYNELCYDVDQQLKYDTLHPPPRRIPSTPPRHNLPDHRAYINPGYSQHIAHAPLKSASPIESEYNSSSLAVDTTAPVLIEDDSGDHDLTEIPIAIDDSDNDAFDVPVLPSTSLPSRLPPTNRPIDTANASLPTKMPKNWDLMQKYIGFMNMSLVLKHLNTIALDTIVVPDLGRNPSLDRGR